MNKLTALLLPICLFLATPDDAAALCPDQHLAWVRLDAPDTMTGRALLQGFRRPCTAVLDRAGDHYLISAPAEAYPAWETAGLRFLHVGPAPAPPPAIRWSELGGRLVALAQAHPEIVRLHRLGFTDGGHPLFALEIGEAPGDRVGRPVVRVTGAHHGNEVVSTDVVLGIADFLVGPQAQQLRATFDFWLFPVVNPEGFEARTRYNDSGADLNRDYGMYWDDELAPFSQPETRAQLSFGTHFPPVLSLDYHSEAEYVNTVYDGSPVTPPELATILELAEVYAGPSNLEVIVGWDWYAAYGSCQDFLHGTLGTLAYTIETLQPTNTAAVVAANVDALQDLATHLQERMICGRVTDSSGRPLRARLHVGTAPQPFFTGAAGTFCHVTDADPIQWVVEAPRHARGTFSTPLAQLPDPLEFELAPSTGSFGAFRLIAAGGLGNAANSPNPAYQALSVPDGRHFILGREGFIVLDFGLPLRDGAGAELTVVFDPARQGARVRASVSDTPFGPFSPCGDYTGDFDLELSACNSPTARFLRLANLLQTPQAALDGLLIPQTSVPSDVDADADGVSEADDCDDDRAAIGPGFEELCDGLDNDCDGLIDEGWPVDSAGGIDCTEPDAGPDAGDGDVPDADTDAGDGEVPDADTDADADAGPPKPRDGVSCQCRHAGDPARPAPLPLALPILGVAWLFLRRKYR